MLRIIAKQKLKLLQYIARRFRDDLEVSLQQANLVGEHVCRSPEEADAQAVRVAVLLDELDFPGFEVADPRTGHIVVEVKTPDALELIKYSCSDRVMALPTGLMNAHRYLLRVTAFSCHYIAPSKICPQ